MVEMETFEELSEEKLEAADVIMVIGVGDPHAPKVLLGRQKIVSAARNPGIAEETNILRVKVANEEELEELTEKVKQAKGELDPDCEEE